MLRRIASLGAAALGDIGAYFPDTKAEFKNIDSRILLRQVFEMTVEKAMSIVNIDITILAQAPKMAAFIHDMRRNIASDLETDIGNVNIKASTTEGLGFVGRKEGIAVHAVVLLA